MCDRTRITYILTHTHHTHTGADSLKDAISQANEEGVERKEVLEKKITQVVAKDATLRSEVKRHVAHADDLRHGVEEKSDVVMRLESEYIAAEREVVDLKATHDRQIANLKKKLDNARAEVREMEPKVKAAELELKSVNEKYEESVKRNENCSKLTRNAESQFHIYENRLRELDNQQKESLESVKRLEHSLSLLDGRYDEKVAESSEHRKRLNEIAAKEAFQKKVLAAEAKARHTLESSLAREREIIKSLEVELKQEESEFESDSVLVKRRISELQSLLVERADAADSLDANLHKTIKATSELRVKLEDARSRHEEQNRALEQRHRRLVESLERHKVEHHNKSLQVKTLKAEIERNTSIMNETAKSIRDADERVTLLTEDIRLERDHTTMLQEKLDKRVSYESELKDKIDSREIKINELRTLVKEKTTSEQSMIAKAKAMEQEIDEIRQDLIRREDSEKNLIDELESTRRVFASVSPTRNGNLLADQASRVEKSRAEYAGLLLDVLRREGVDNNDTDEEEVGEKVEEKNE